LSKKVRIFNFVPEKHEPYNIRGKNMKESLLDDAVLISQYIKSYFRYGYYLLPIGEENDFITLFDLTFGNKSSQVAGSSPLIKAILYAIVALSIKYSEGGDESEAEDLAALFYSHAGETLESEPNDARFEYLLASTLLVSNFNTYTQTLLMISQQGWFCMHDSVRGTAFI
jgi:hypothetical protein